MTIRFYKKESTAKDGTKFILREPKLSDAKQLMEEINQFVDEPYSGLSINKKVSLNEEKAWLKSVLNDIKKNKKIHLVVEVNKKICGGCGIERKRWKQGHSAVLGIGILKEIRRKGIGSLMIKEAISLARERMNQLECIDLSVYEYNKKAQKFYKKMGFKKIGRIKDTTKEDGKYFDETFLRYKL